MTRIPPRPPPALPPVPPVPPVDPVRKDPPRKKPDEPPRKKTGLSEADAIAVKLDGLNCTLAWLWSTLGATQDPATVEAYHTLLRLADDEVQYQRSRLGLVK